MSEVLLYGVVVNRDDTVRVVSHPAKETPSLYLLGHERYDWNDPRREAHNAVGNYRSRVPKSAAFTSARAALEAYMKRRQSDKASAQAVIGQATKQIASANELLMHLPDEAATA